MEGGGGRLSNALKMIPSKIRWKRNVNGAKKGTKSALDKMKKSVNIAKPNLFSTKFMKKFLMPTQHDQKSYSSTIYTDSTAGGIIGFLVHVKSYYNKHWIIKVRIYFALNKQKIFIFFRVPKSYSKILINK